jgi:hypothetical protein
MLWTTVGRDEQDARDAQEARLRAILARGRQTRKPTPRWLWIAAAIVGAICAVGFAVVMLADRGPPNADDASHRLERRPVTGSGLGIGLVLGAGVGVVIGFAIARQRGDHSSRNSP